MDGFSQYAFRNPAPTRDALNASQAAEAAGPAGERRCLGTAIPIPWLRFRGVRFAIHPSFTALALLTLLLAAGDRTCPLGEAIAWAGAGVAVLLISVIVHEAGHLAARQGSPTTASILRLSPFGAVPTPPARGEPTLTEAVAGPASNLAVAVLCTLGVAGLGGGSTAFTAGDFLTLSFPLHESVAATALRLAAWINACLAVATLLPVAPCDGATLVRRCLGAGSGSAAGDKRAAIGAALVTWGVAVSAITAGALLLGREPDAPQRVPLAPALFVGGIAMLLSRPWRTAAPPQAPALTVRTRSGCRSWPLAGAIRRPTATGRLTGTKVSNPLRWSAACFARSNSAARINAEQFRWETHTGDASGQTPTTHAASPASSAALVGPTDPAQPAPPAFPAKTAQGPDAAQTPDAGHLDDLLRKLHRVGWEGLSDGERAYLRTASARYRATLSARTSRSGK